MLLRIKPFQYLTVLLSFSVIGQVCLTSCTREGRGFALPPGNMEAGKAAFTNYSCNSCHSVADIKWKGTESDPHVELGGEVSKIKTYGELVTSVINPSHKVAYKYLQTDTGQVEVSKMKNYNEVLTVQDLVDIVTYLQSEYEFRAPPTNYPPYSPR